MADKMDIDAAPGTKVTYNGNDLNRHGQVSENKVKALVVGKEYTVARTVIHSYHTDVYLYGLQGAFNSCWFDKVE